MMKLYTNPHSKPKLFSNSLFFLSLFLSVFGCIMIYSATVCKSYPNYIFLKKQIIAIFIGLIICILTSHLTSQFFKKITSFLFIITVILLISVFFFKKANYANRWIVLPFLGSFQPSELAKLVSVLITAKFLDLYRSKIISGKKEFWILFFLISVICGLIIIQPDLGFPLIIFSVFLITLFIYSVKLTHIFKVSLLIILALTLAFFSKPYRVKRVFSMNANTHKYQKNEAYQINQSILGLARGGFYGCGLTKGIFKEFYIPELHTDFMFSLIGEELGFLGTFLVVLLYGIFAFLGFSLFYSLYNSHRGFYGSVIALGVTLTIIIQAYLSIAVTTKLFFPKGIGLPFLSYGGSSIITNFLSIGILISISNTEK
ncbi:MAG: FtsW/RodA/SpoVE family cell cycle protein [Endomicrobiia bacterium]